MILDNFKSILQTDANIDEISVFSFFNNPWFHRPMNMYRKLNIHLITKKKVRKMYRIQNKNELEQSLGNNVKMNEVKYFSYQKHFIFCVYLRFTYLSTWVLNQQHQHCWVFIHSIQMWSKLSTCFHMTMLIAQSNCLSSAYSILIFVNTFLQQFKNLKKNIITFNDVPLWQWNKLNLGNF